MTTQPLPWATPLRELSEYLLRMSEGQEGRSREEHHEERESRGHRTERSGHYEERESRGHRSERSVQRERGGRERHRVGRGDVYAATLLLLDEQSLHGYQIIQLIEERSGGNWRPSAGSVYPALQLLEDQGYIQGEQQESRRVFHLTEAGRAYIPDHRTELVAARDAVTARMDSGDSDCRTCSTRWKRRSGRSSTWGPRPNWQPPRNCWSPSAANSIASLPMTLPIVHVIDSNRGQSNAPQVRPMERR